MKKVLSLVLVLALVLGSFSFAFAFDDVAGQDCEDAVDTLVALGVINGFNDGTFRPEDTVTRAQMAKMLVVALGYEDLISGTSSSFNDMNGHWADSYVAFAAGQGIVNGYPDGSFKPNATVSYDEAITMVVRALGYTDDSLSGTWPTSYKIKALDLDITKDVKITTGGADRGGVAMLIYNALEAEIITVNADDEIVYAKTEEAKVTVIDRLGNKKNIHVEPKILDEDDDDYQMSDVDLLQYMYEDLEVYTVENDDNDEVVVYVSDRTIKEGTDVMTGTIDSMTDTNITLEDADEDLHTFNASEINLFVNGAAAVDGKTDLSVIKAAVDNGVTVTIKAVFTTDKDSEITESKSVVSNAEAAVVSYATDVVQIDKEYDADDLDIDGIKLPITIDEDNDDEEIVDLDNLTITGDATSLEDIRENDIVVVYAADVDSADDSNPQAVKLAVSRQTLEGKVQKKFDDDTFQIDGVKVNTTEYAKITSIESEIKLSQEGIFYLDDNGEIVVFDGTSELENYAVVVGVEPGDFSTDFEDISIDNYAQVKLATAEGETVVYNIYSDYDSSKDAGKEFESFKISKTETNATKISIVDGKPKAINVDDLYKTPGTLIKYDLNSDDQIDEIEVVEFDYKLSDADLEVSGSNLGDKFRFTNNTIIFDATDGDYKIVDLADIKEDVALDVALVKEEDSTFGNIEVIIIPAGSVDSSNDGTYAMILDAFATLDSDDDTVQELSLLIDGVEKTYLTDDKGVVTETEVTTDFYFNLYELTIDNDLVTDCKNITETEEYTKATPEYAVYGEAFNDLTVQAIDADDQVVRFDDSNYSISDNAVVYVANYDFDDDKWTVTAGDVNDIDEEDYIKSYNLDVDDSDEDGLDVIIVFTGDTDKLLAK